MDGFSSAACYDFAYVPIVYVRTYVRIRVRGKKAEAERERDRWKDIATWKCNAGRANALDPKKLGSISDG